MRKYMMATKAFSKVWDDISRDKEDLCFIYKETDECWIGNWVTGLGFFDVHFPKETTRELTKKEVEEYNKKWIQINNQPPVKLEIEVQSNKKKDLICSMFGTEEENVLMSALLLCSETEDTKDNDKIYDFLENTPKASLVSELVYALKEFGYHIRKNYESNQDRNK